MDDLERSIVGGVDQLYQRASTAIQSSHGALKEYARFSRAMVKRLNELAISRSGGHLFLPPELRNLSVRLQSNSAALTNTIRKMQERLRQLVSDLEEIKKLAAKKALRYKVWGYVAKAFGFLSKILAVGGPALAFLHPLGPLQSAVLIGASKLFGELSKLAQSLKDSECPTSSDLNNVYILMMNTFLLPKITTT